MAIVLRDNHWNRWNGTGFQMVADHWSNDLLVTNHRSEKKSNRSLILKRLNKIFWDQVDKEVWMVAANYTSLCSDHLNLYCIDIMDLLAAIINRAVICEERYAAQEQYIWPCLVIRTLVSCHQIMRRSQRFEWMRIINTTANGAHRFNSWTAVNGCSMISSDHHVWNNFIFSPLFSDF